jgi:zinc transport system ATP-binding protein
MIDIEDVCFWYEDTEVLHNINLKLPQGCFAVIVGPNGGGKTTLLRLILGLLQPRLGSIKVMGTTPEKARTQLAYVPQSIQYDQLFPVSVQDIALMGRIGSHWIGGYSKRDKEIASQALKEVDMGDMGKRTFAELSGGERQRALIAQALASQPKLLLLDEPGANLDPDNRLHLYELLTRLNDRMTILMVSHNLNVIASHASHVICVNRQASLHLISEVSHDALANGAWAHLQHQHCPVSDHEIAAETSPHCALKHKS